MQIRRFNYITTSLKNRKSVKIRFYKIATGIDFHFVTKCDIKKKKNITKTENFYGTVN